MKINKSLILILFIIISYPFVAKYTFVQHNQYEQIPLVLKFLDPSFLQNDWVTNLNSIFSPRYFFTVYIGTLARYIPLYIVYYLNYILTVALVTIATFSISKKIFKSDFTAFITTIIILYGEKITLGGNDLIGRDLDPPRMAFAFAVFGISMLLSKRYLFTAVCFAISSYLQPLIGFEVPLIIYSASILSIIFREKKQKKIIIEKILPFLGSFVLYMVLVSASTVSFFLTYINQNHLGISTPLLITIISKIRSPFHYLPSAFPALDYIRFTLLLIFFYIFYHIYRKNIEPFHRVLIKLIFIIIFLLCIIASIFSEIIPFYPIIIMQFFRLTVLVYWMAAIIVFGGCFNYFENKINIHNWQIFIVGILPFLLSQQEIIFSPTPNRILFIVLAAIWIILFYIVKKEIIKYYLLFLLLGLFALLYRHYPILLTQLYPYPNSQTNLANWVNENTSSDSVFLLPPDFYSFRLIAKRAIIVDWLVLPFQEKAIAQWMERITDISGLDNQPISKITERNVFEGYKKIDQLRIMRLTSKYKFDYVVINKQKHLPYNLIYTNEDYSIYKI